MLSKYKEDFNVLCSTVIALRVSGGPPAGPCALHLCPSNQESVELENVPSQSSLSPFKIPSCCGALFVKAGGENVFYLMVYDLDLKLINSWTTHGPLNVRHCLQTLGQAFASSCGSIVLAFSLELQETLVGGESSWWWAAHELIFSYLELSYMYS